jgi:hypothetical protein
MLIEVLVAGKPIQVRTDKQPDGWWWAIDDNNFDGAEDARPRIGYGPTEQDAIDALLLEMEG